MLRNTRIVLLSVLSFGLPTSALASICDAEDQDLLGATTCERLDADAAVLEAAGLSPLAPVVLAAPVQEDGEAAWIESIDGQIALDDLSAGLTLNLDDGAALGLAVGLLAEGEQGLMLALPGEQLLVLDGVGLVAVGVTNDHLGINEIAVGVTNDHLGIGERAVGVTNDHRGVDEVVVGVTNDHRGVDLVAVGVTNDHRGSASLVVGPVREEAIGWGGVLVVQTR